jgi:hypothetical protein
VTCSAGRVNPSACVCADGTYDDKGTCKPCGHRCKTCTAKHDCIKCNDTRVKHKVTFDTVVFGGTSFTSVTTRFTGSFVVIGTVGTSTFRWVNSSGRTGHTNWFFVWTNFAGLTVSWAFLAIN